MTSSSSAQFGIYYGGSSMSIAYSRDDKHSIVVNEAGYRSTPAVLALADKEFLVGVPAKQNLIRNSRNSVLFAKHLINDDQGDTTTDAIVQRLDCQVKEATKAGEKRVFVIEDKEITVCDAIQRQLHYLNELGKSSLGVKECNAVLAVPFHFKPSQSDFLRDCATKAGFKVLRVIKNPVAACLGYDLEEDDTSDITCLVYQMGGNSLELSLVNISNGLMRVLDSTLLPGIGGDLFTSVVVDILCEEFQRKHKANPRENKRSMFKLKSNAEELKHILSTMERAHCSIDALYDGIDFDYYLTRQRFESGCVKLYQQILQPVDDLLRANGLAETQIDRVIVCGAATKMCKLQALLGQKFEVSKVLNYQSPDEVIAVGCAKQCALMTGSKRQAPLQTGDSVFKCLASPIYYKISTGEKVLLLKEKLPLPIKRSVNFEFSLDNPLLTIIENDKDLVKIDLKTFKSKEATLLIKIKMNETIEVTVSETSSNERITLFLNSESAAEM